MKRAKKLHLVTTNKEHPAASVRNPNLDLIEYKDEIDFADLFKLLKSKGIERVTIQSGGEMNATLIRSGLVDFISIVVAPLIVGGKETATLIGGKSLEIEQDLRQLKILELQEAKTLRNSYLYVRYKVDNDQEF